MTEDEKIFGADAWVYCSDHRNAHQTGWCSIGVNRKLGLGIFGTSNRHKALEKCHEFGLMIPDEKRIARVGI